MLLGVLITITDFLHVFPAVGKVFMMSPNEEVLVQFTKKSSQVIPLAIILSKTMNK